MCLLTAAMTVFTELHESFYKLDSHWPRHTIWSWSGPITDFVTELLCLFACPTLKCYNVPSKKADWLRHVTWFYLHVHPLGATMCFSTGGAICRGVVWKTDIQTKYHCL